MKHLYIEEVTDYINYKNPRVAKAVIERLVDLLCKTNTAPNSTTVRGLAEWVAMNNNWLVKKTKRNR